MNDTQHRQRQNGSRCYQRSIVLHCVIASSVNMYIAIAILPSALPREAPSGQLSAMVLTPQRRASKTVARKCPLCLTA